MTSLKGKSCMQYNFPQPVTQHTIMKIASDLIDSMHYTYNKPKMLQWLALKGAHQLYCRFVKNYVFDTSIGNAISFVENELPIAAKNIGAYLYSQPQPITSVVNMYDMEFNMASNPQVKGNKNTTMSYLTSNLNELLSVYLNAVKEVSNHRDKKQQSIEEATYASIGRQLLEPHIETVSPHVIINKALTHALNEDHSLINKVCWEVGASLHTLIIIDDLDEHQTVEGYINKFYNKNKSIGSYIHLTQSISYQSLTQYITLMLQQNTDEGTEEEALIYNHVEEILNNLYATLQREDNENVLVQIEKALSSDEVTYNKYTDDKKFKHTVVAKMLASIVNYYLNTVIPAPIKDVMGKL